MKMMQHVSVAAVVRFLLLISGGGTGVCADTETPGFSTTAKTSSPDGKPALSEVKPATTKIYKYFNGGTTSFSDVPPSKLAYVVFNPSCYACNVNSNIDWQTTKLHLVEFQVEIGDAAIQFELDPTLVRAVVHAESGFNVQARSKKGAIGLMQLMPGTSTSLGISDPRIPSQNIQGGVQYLAQMMVRFKNDVSLATAAYNAGPEAVQKYAGIPPYAETRIYVQRVKILHQRYKESLQR